MAEKYIVRLTGEEREELIGPAEKGGTGARKINRAHILLPADGSGNSPDRGIRAERIRRRSAEGGPGKALNGDPGDGAPGILNG